MIKTMSDNVNEMLGRIAVASLQKCVGKLSRVSAGVWSIAGAEVSTGTLEETINHRGPQDAEATAVYFEVKGDLPFVAVILFDPRDIDRISKCFLGYSFSVSPVLTQAGEMLLSELGNIILNSFISALSNTLKRVFMPSAPECLSGQPQSLLESMSTAVDIRRSCYIVRVKLDLKCGESVTRSEVLGLIPEKLAQELLATEEKDKHL